MYIFVTLRCICPEAPAYFREMYYSFCHRLGLFSRSPYRFPVRENIYLRRLSSVCSCGVMRLSHYVTRANRREGKIAAGPTQGRWPKTSLPLYTDGRHGGLGCPTNLRQSLMRSTIQQVNVLGLVHPLTIT